MNYAIILWKKVINKKIEFQKLHFEYIIEIMSHVHGRLTIPF